MSHILDTSTVHKCIYNASVALPASKENDSNQDELEVMNTFYEDVKFNTDYGRGCGRTKIQEKESLFLS